MTGALDPPVRRERDTPCGPGRATALASAESPWSPGADRYEVGSRLKAAADAISLPLFGLLALVPPLARSATGAVRWALIAVVVVGLVNKGREHARMAYRLEVGGSSLRWWTLVGSGDVDLATVTVVRRSRASRRVVVIELSRRGPVVIRLRPGFTELLDVMLAARPDLPITMDRPALAERSQRSYFTARVPLGPVTASARPPEPRSTASGGDIPVRGSGCRCRVDGGR